MDPKTFRTAYEELDGNSMPPMWRFEDTQQVTEKVKKYPITCGCVVITAILVVILIVLLQTSACSSLDFASTTVFSLDYVYEGLSVHGGKYCAVKVVPTDQANTTVTVHHRNNRDSLSGLTPQFSPLGYFYELPVTVRGPLLELHLAQTEAEYTGACHQVFITVEVPLTLLPLRFLDVLVDFGETVNETLGHEFPVQIEDVDIDVIKIVLPKGQTHISNIASNYLDITSTLVATDVVLNGTEPSRIPTLTCTTQAGIQRMLNVSGGSVLSSSWTGALTVGVVDGWTGDVDIDANGGVDVSVAEDVEYTWSVETSNRIGGTVGTDESNAKLQMSTWVGRATLTIE